MGKRKVLKGIMLPMAVILAAVMSGCSEDPIYPSRKVSEEEAVMIGPDGGIVIAMDGNVVLTIPAGALNEPAKFYVHDLLNRSARDYALNTIVIEPVVVFKTPVQLTLKYDGCLGNGSNLCDAKSVSFLIWNDEGAFLNQIKPTECPACDINTVLHTVCNCIGKTGVVAVLADW